MPLNAFGRVQAEEAARRLAAVVPDPGALEFVASPLSRTRETMEILRRTLGLQAQEYRTDARLMELTFGRWEGMTWREVRHQHASLASARQRDKWNFTPPDGESYAMLRARIEPAVREFVQPALIVSHGGVARALLNVVAGVPADRAPLIDIWQGRVLVLSQDSHRWA